MRQQREQNLEHFNAVHLRQHLGQDSIPDPSAGSGASLWTQGIDLVEEDDAGCHPPSFAEEGANGKLGLADPLAEQLRALDGDEVELALVRQRLGDHGLRAAYKASRPRNKWIWGFKK